MKARNTPQNYYVSMIHWTQDHRVEHSPPRIHIRCVCKALQGKETDHDLTTGGLLQDPCNDAIVRGRLSEASSHIFTLYEATELAAIPRISSDRTFRAVNAREYTSSSHNERSDINLGNTAQERF